MKPAPLTSRLGIEASSNSDYMKQYRERRRQNSMSRISKKLKLLNPAEIRDIERVINDTLGKERLPEPNNPWYFDRRINKPKVKKARRPKPKVQHPDML